ncbi:hypothetical protein Daci_1959 [Delftia acidovorans SPH-1]|uniref:Uncharacterized protein n=1 Tax=Delftia acidovorans (strain DSM 14801 / SPH-1) TaxID=398578 RepID=A9BYQ6_DELAS|nr:hypothetical protein [Delftia acidovorans]ABX34599.1 hypothetical protein Daci_1959 [Delftia acidovorans SPH-1]QPS76033.1 hypothetical protein I6G48_05615 [Delftia acidovorans]
MDVRLPDGTIISNVPDGTTKADLVTKLQKNGMAVPADWLQQSAPAAPSNPVQDAGRAVNRGISDLPRQVGLAGRYGLEGLANAAQVFTEPVAGLMRMAGINTAPLGQVATSAADAIGLPKPRDELERVVGDATRLVAGAGGTLGGAQQLAKLPGMIGSVGSALSTAPTAQLSSAAGGGGLSGLSREGGGDELQQAAAGLIGGVAGGFAPGLVQGATAGVKRALAPKMTPQQLDAQINVIFERSGGDYSQIPERARQALRTELRDALQAGKELNPDAVRRLADFTATGLTPTRGSVTLNPVQITREMNLAKIGANAGNADLQGLAQIQNENNVRLIQSLNEQGATRGDLQRAGEQITSSILGRRDNLRSAEQAAWDAAKSSPGYRQPISPKVISDINQTLGEEGLMPFMNPGVSRYMEAFMDGKQPFTPQDYRNLQSMLSREIARGGNEGYAAKTAARVLSESQVQPITNPGGIDFGNSVLTGDMAQRLRTMDAAPGSAIDAVNRARGATRSAYAYEDSSPLVREALSGGNSADPANIAKKYVIGGTPNQAQMLAKEIGPQGVPVIRDAIVAHLKEKALNRGSDEVGKFSQSAYNKALADIGEKKLGLFFQPEEIESLKRLGRVASYTQVQPVGSAVGNSNTPAVLLGRGLDLLGKVPFIGPMAANPLNNLQISIREGAAQNVRPGLLGPVQKEPVMRGLLNPALAYTGGLLAPPP